MCLLQNNLVTMKRNVYFKCISNILNKKCYKAIDSLLFIFNEDFFFHSFFSKRYSREIRREEEKPNLRVFYQWNVKSVNGKVNMNGHYG